MAEARPATLTHRPSATLVSALPQLSRRHADIDPRMTQCGVRAVGTIQNSVSRGRLCFSQRS